MSSLTQQAVTEYFAAIRAMNVDCCIAVLRSMPNSTILSALRQTSVTTQSALSSQIFSGFKNFGLSETAPVMAAPQP